MSYLITIYNFLKDAGIAFKSTFIAKIMFLISNNLFLLLLAIIIPLSLAFYYISISSFFKKEENKEDENTDFFPFVTVQIPTYNELAAINCAKKCLEFDYPKNKYEILIGDDSNKL